MMGWQCSGKMRRDVRLCYDLRFDNQINFLRDIFDFLNHVKIILEHGIEQSIQLNHRTYFLRPPIHVNWVDYIIFL